jgi:hypothetical protein
LLFSPTNRHASTTRKNVKQHSGVLQTEVHPVLVGDNTNKGGNEQFLLLAVAGIFT